MGNAKIINESGGPYEKMRIRIAVGVTYGSDVHIEIPYPKRDLYVKEMPVT